MVKLECPVGYINITEGSRAELGCSVYPSMDLDLSLTTMYHTGHPNLALEPSVTSMYPTGVPNLALDPSVTSMYHTRHPSLAL
jgi:hypothetical protein